MDSIIKLPNCLKCLTAREVEKASNRTLILEDSRVYVDSNSGVTAEDLRVLHQVLHVEEWSRRMTSKKRTHLLVLQMDQAAMYTRSKAIREFAHNFVCFV